MPKEQKKEPLDDLSPRAQSIVKIRKLVGTGKHNFKYWRGILKELAKFDMFVDTARDKLQIRQTITIILTVLALIGSIIVVMVSGEMSYSIGKGLTALVVTIVCGLFVFGVVMSIKQGIKLSSLKKINLIDDFRLSLAPFFEDLADDIDPKSSLKLNIDLKGLTPEKIVKKEKIPPGRFDKIVETIWNDPWCAVQLKLADGSMLTLSINNHTVCHDRHWKVRRGAKTKYKSKKKWRKLVVITAMLIPNADGLSWDEEKITRKSASEKLKTLKKKGVPTCKLVRKYKFKNVYEPPEESVNPTEIVSMFMELYSMMNPKDKGAEANV